MTDHCFNDTKTPRLLDIALETLRNKISARDSLPAYLSLPRIRARLWPRHRVEAWISEVAVQCDADSALNQGGNHG